MASKKFVDTGNPPSAGKPDTYGGAKYVSRVNKVAQPHPSGGELYGLPRAVDPMLLRSLQQRRSQTPMRSIEESGSFFEAGTHGQAFVKGTLGQVGAKPGLGRALFGRPSARQAAANRGMNAGRHSSGDDTLGVLDEAFSSRQGTGLVGKVLGSSDRETKSLDGRRGPWDRHSKLRNWNQGESYPTRGEGREADPDPVVMPWDASWGSVQPGDTVPKHRRGH